MENNSQKFIVYLTINLNNKKKYVGVHSTKTPDKFDGYLCNGSWVQTPSTTIPWSFEMLSRIS